MGVLQQDWRDGMHPSMRAGLQALLLGTLVVVMVAVLLSPTVAGLTGLPSHILDRPVDRSKPHVRLTPAQRLAARRTAVRVALSQVGVREHGGANRGSRIVAYRRAVSGVGENPRSAEPWCADFVSWAWQRAGVPLGFGGRGSDYVPELSAWAKLSHRWHWARDSYRPRPGDLVVFRSGRSRRGHIGLVTSFNNGWIRTVEGNWSDRVARRTMRPGNAIVTGFISPV